MKETIIKNNEVPAQSFNQTEQSKSSKKYHLGQCQGLPCEDKKEKVPLIGYCYFNNQIIEEGFLKPSGEKEKLEYCLNCYLYFKPMMEKRFERQIREGFIPFKWFWFYDPEDEEILQRTESKKLTLDEREEKISQKVAIRAVCRQCLSEIPSLTNRGLALSASEKILAEHKCILDTNIKTPIETKQVLAKGLEGKIYQYIKKLEREKTDLKAKIKELSEPINKTQELITAIQRLKVKLKELKPKDDFEKPQEKKQLEKIKGILTSNLRTRTSSNTPYMAFFRANDDCEKVYRHSLAQCEAQKCKECEIPVIFRIKTCDGSSHNCYKPNLKKGDRVILEGEFSQSKDSNRPSFTCYNYEIISHE